MRVDYLNCERLCTNLFLNRTNGGVLAHNSEDCYECLLISYQYF